MKTLLHDMDVREEGRQEGIRDIVLNMLRKGMEVMDICELAGCTEEYVDSLKQLL